MDRARAGRNGVGDRSNLEDLKDNPSTAPDLRLHEIQQTLKPKATVIKTREESTTILYNKYANNRLFGPSSIHNPEATLECAKCLLALKQKHADELLIIISLYLKKPRSTIGWKVLIIDPEIDGSFKINKHGMPLASTTLDTISPQFLVDLLSMEAISARTRGTESQFHRDLASDVSFQVRMLTPYQVWDQYSELGKFDGGFRVIFIWRPPNDTLNRSAHFGYSPCREA
ncbi:3-deoxy-7-phosphoheptulonate synthase [Rhizina undulata]